MTTKISAKEIKQMTDLSSQYLHQLMVDTVIYEILLKNGMGDRNQYKFFSQFAERLVPILLKYINQKLEYFAIFAEGNTGRTRIKYKSRILDLYKELKDCVDRMDKLKGDITEFYKMIDTEIEDISYSYKLFTDDVVDTDIENIKITFKDGRVLEKNSKDNFGFE